MKLYCSMKVVYGDPKRIKDARSISCVLELSPLLSEGSTHLPLPITALSLKSSGLKLNIPSASLKDAWSVSPPAAGMVSWRRCPAFRLSYRNWLGYRD